MGFMGFMGFMGKKVGFMGFMGKVQKDELLFLNKDYYEQLGTRGR